MLMKCVQLLKNNRCYEFICDPRPLFTYPVQCFLEINDTRLKSYLNKRFYCFGDGSNINSFVKVEEDKSDDNKSDTDSPKIQSDSNIQRKERGTEYKVDGDTNFDHKSNEEKIKTDLSTVKLDSQKPVKSTKKLDIKSKLIDEGVIKQYLTEKRIKHVTGYSCYLIYCPRLKNKTIPSVNSADTMFINKITGYFVCQHCGKCGDWLHLVDNISVFAGLQKKTSIDCFNEIASVKNLNQTSPQISEIIAKTVSLDSLSVEKGDQILEEFKMEALGISTLVTYNVRYSETTQSLYFPFYNSDNEIVSLKILTCNRNGELKESIVPSSHTPGLFGWNLTAKQKEIVLASTERDAMSIKEKSKRVALTLPKGYSVLPQEVLPLLERFQKIIIWFGDDISSWEAAKQFSKKLNHERCYLIRPSLENPRPYQALDENLSLGLILSKGKQIHIKSITTFSELRSSVFLEFAHKEKVSGIKWKRYKTLNPILKGHRRGELTVFTGPTGSGKTTFISDYSLDLAMQGVNTLWGSFEINNARLLKMMLTQFAQQDLSKNLTEFDDWADKFEELPLYLMTFHGQQSIKEVLDTMSHAVYAHDISHVIVDNLQFMMGMTDTGADKFALQDKIVAGFRKFATQKNCHVTLVIHPRKEKETEDLTISSIFGSAKVTQEADNIMILQDKRLTTLTGRKYVQIIKNRYDGDLGVIPLKYDKESMSYLGKDIGAKKLIVNKDTNPNDIE